MGYKLLIGINSVVISRLGRIAGKPCPDKNKDKQCGF